jgi:hypothetical protein
VHEHDGRPPIAVQFTGQFDVIERQSIHGPTPDAIRSIETLVN